MANYQKDGDRPIIDAFGGTSHGQKPVVNIQYSHAECPTEEVISKRPSHVNVNSVGTYAFLYQTTSSIGGDVSGQIGNFISGSILANAAGGPLTLQIRVRYFLVLVWEDQLVEQEQGREEIVLLVLLVVQLFLVHFLFYLDKDH